MHLRVELAALAALALLTVGAQRPAAAQSHGHAGHDRSAPDTAFHALQKRGADVMGVDQYTSVHHFEALADGGRIELQRDRDDTVGTRAIRDHLRTIARQFAGGDFSASATVHARAVPGTEAMRTRRSLIRYEFRPLERGGELRLITRDREALLAIHRFLAFQRAEHRAWEK